MKSASVAGRTASKGNTAAVSGSKRFIIGIIGVLVLFGAGLWNLDGPQMRWDEGWTLSVARTWVEHGVYGRLLEDQFASAGLSAAVPVTAPVALSFRLFDVGIWQGRLPGLLFMIGTLIALSVLAYHLYTEGVAVATIVFLLGMSMHPEFHPLLMGRQVLAEMPMLCYLLWGYVFLLLALQRSPWFLLGALPLWALGIYTKAQPEPFWVVSLLLPLVLLALLRQWRMAGMLALALVATPIIERVLLPPLFRMLLPSFDGTLRYNEPVQGLGSVMAVVLEPFNRFFALKITLFAALPLVLGLGYAAWGVVRRQWRAAPLTPAEVVRLVLLALAGSWFAWYLLLSVGVPRYLAPAVVIGSIFVAALLADLTEHFNLSAVLRHTTNLLTLRAVHRKGIAAFATVLAVFFTVSITLLTLQRYYLHADTHAAVEVAHWLNTETPPDALIETYESELHFLLERPYHYPPDQTHVTLNRRSLLQQEVTIAYDPLAADPDYLVVGTFSRENDLYAPVLQSGAFRLVQQNQPYEVYERVR
jgi:hypothetical protein